MITPYQPVKVLNMSINCKIVTCQSPAMPREKCYRKEVMPQIENVTQIIVRAPEGGRPTGVNNERETGGNEGIYALLPKSDKKRQADFA
jgi:hypothetical protein